MKTILASEALSFF